jgi:hypothetical protein
MEPKVYLNASAVYKTFINLVVRLFLRRGSGVSMNGARKEHCTFDNEVSTRGKA